MPRILVADDNSNIHRTVALALKEAGVEVVAVGNGEAAVRKIAEIKPDLVLADIFMPVRSGYEVCEFVKKDERFSSIPVVLLIGAFDPFDEREAQRVQADAILKKPFVPPDSLLRTVSDLLAQSVSRSTPAAVETPKPAERPPAPAPVNKAPAVEYMDQPPEEIEPAKELLEWGSGEQPLAFETLLETPSVEPVTEEAMVTSRRDPSLGEPAFWTQKAQPEGEETESEEENSEAGSPTGLVDIEQWSSAAKASEPQLLAPIETVPEAEEPASLLSLDEFVDESAPGFAPYVPPVKQDADTSAEALPDLTIALSKLLSPEPERAEDLEELPELDEFLPMPPLPAEKAEEPEEELVAVSKPSEPKEEFASASKLAEPKEEPIFVSKPVPDEEDFAWASPAYELEKAGPAEKAEAELKPDAGPSEDEKSIEAAAARGLATLAPFLESLTTAALARDAGATDPFDFGPLPASTEPESDAAESEPAESSVPPTAPKMDPAVVEAIAQRVIDRMQPQLFELVTRELLRPAVEALVQRELEKK